MKKDRYKEFKRYWLARLQVLKGRKLTAEEKNEINFWAIVYANTRKFKLTDFFQPEQELFDFSNKLK